MLTIFIRAAILFSFAVIAMRIMGKRQVGQLEPFELVIAILIAELAATPMEDAGKPLLFGIVPILTLMMLHSALSIISYKSKKLRGLINGKPSVLIKNGELQQKELERICYDLNDLIGELRCAGFINVGDVGTAILETSGKMSVLPKAENRPATTKDLHIAVGYEGIPLTLILDGAIQHKSLSLGGLNEPWLTKTLEALGFTAPKDIIIASLDTSGKLFVQSGGADPRLRHEQVLEPEKVGW